MKKILVREIEKLYYTNKNKEILGKHSNLSGDCSGLRGDLDSAELTKEERNIGINIEDLVK